MMDLSKRLWSPEDIAADTLDCEALAKVDAENFVIAAEHNPEKVVYSNNEIAWDRPLWYALIFASRSSAEEYLEENRFLIKTIERHRKTEKAFSAPLSVFRLSQAAKVRKLSNEIWLALYDHIKLGGTPI